MKKYLPKKQIDIQSEALMNAEIKTLETAVQQFYFALLLLGLCILLQTQAVSALDESSDDLSEAIKIIKSENWNKSGCLLESVVNQTIQSYSPSIVENLIHCHTHPNHTLGLSFGFQPTMYGNPSFFNLQSHLYLLDELTESALPFSKIYLNNGLIINPELFLSSSQNNQNINLSKTSLLHTIGIESRLWGVNSRFGAGFNWGLNQENKFFMSPVLQVGLGLSFFQDALVTQEFIHAYEQLRSKKLTSFIQLNKDFGLLEGNALGLWYFRDQWAAGFSLNLFDQGYLSQETPRLLFALKSRYYFEPIAIGLNYFIEGNAGFGNVKLLGAQIGFEHRLSESLVYSFSIGLGLTDAQTKLNWNPIPLFNTSISYALPVSLFGITD